MKKTEIIEGYKIENINIIIDSESKTFSGLFLSCNCIKKLKFIKFNREDIDNMSNMFSTCSSLEELDLSNFKTDKVKLMNEMFKDCSSLKIRYLKF